MSTLPTQKTFGSLVWLMALSAIVVAVAHPVAYAQGPFYALIVNGSSNMDVNYQQGYLTVHFRRTLRAAGSPFGYEKNVRPGSAAWPDRPLNAQEPLILKQAMTPQQAQAAIQRLRQNGGYWKFYCRNTGKGYFEVSKSQPAYASVRFD